MNKIILTSLVVTVIMTFSILPAMAETFDTPINISNSPTEISQFPSIATDGTNIFVTWTEETTGIVDIVFSKSTDGGLSFDTPINISNTPNGHSLYPSIATDGTNIFVTWHDNTLGNSGIFLSKSTDGGNTFDTPVNISSSTSFTFKPSIATDGTNIFVTWPGATNDPLAWSAIFLSKSTDGGNTWTSPVKISANGDGVAAPSIATDGTNIFVTWSNNTLGIDEIFFSKSTDGGLSFDTPINISNNIAFSSNPSIATDGTNIFVTWLDTSVGSFEILLSKSTDGGLSFDTPINISNSPTEISQLPSIATDGTNIFVTWTDQNSGNSSIFFSKSTNGGNTFDNPVNVSQNNAFPIIPTIATDGTNIFVTWQTAVSGSEIFVTNAVLSTGCGSTNPNMQVSTENSLSSNTFGGPMVTEVKICDPDISDTAQGKGEPDVTVNGRILRMTQGTDGNWYGYFADRIQAQFADSIALHGPSGTSLDFGQFCKNTSNVLGIDVTDTNSIAIPVDVSTSGTQGTTPITVDCSGAIISTNTNNVVRESIPINPGSITPIPVEIGQIGLADAQFWPFIQLYDFTPTNDVFVQYNKGGGTQTTILTFDNADNFANLVLDKLTYLPGDDVKATISDVQLNIDPTDEDSWTWATLSTGPALFYDLFDENGISTGDAIQTISQDVFINLTNLMFEDNGKLFVEKKFTGQDVLQLEDNNLHNLTPTINGGTASGLISAVRQPVTFTEQSSNSGTFVNFDTSGNSNIDVICDAPNGFAGIIDYNDAPLSILASGTCPTIDSDGDGIVDSVDINPLTPSFQFSDVSIVGGTTFGSVIPGDQNILIIEDVNPNGVEISASSSGGVNPAIISDCNNGANYSLSPGDIISLTCSSSDAMVIQGTVDVEYFVDGGSFATVTLNTGDNVIFEQDSLTFTNNGFLPIILEVNGKQIIINPLSVVEISAPKQTKQHVLDKLEQLEILSEDKKTDKRLEKAIESIEKSLNDKLWLDAFHLDSKKGKKVFDEEKKAVKELRKILDKDDSIDTTLVQMAIDDLCEVSKTLSQTAIDNVNDSDNKKIIQANQKMEKAQSELDKNRCDKAVDNYKEAWKKAQDIQKTDNDEDD